MQGVLVVRDDGLRGTTLAANEPGQTVVEYSDGSSVVIDTESLILQGDGSYRISPRTNSKGVADEGQEDLTIPVVEEVLAIETARVERGRVRVRKRVETREERVDAQVVHEEVVIEHVPVNRFVEETAPEVREEDGVLVIPLVEEVLVVEKRLLLREEIRVSKRRTTTSNPQTVSLRREVVEIEREEPKE